MESDSVINTLNQHVSIRHYKDKDLDDDLLYTILNAARRSPTSSNLQTYSFIVVRNQDTKIELAKLAGNQKHIETCPVFVAICADITRIGAACALHETTLVKSLETSLVSTVDAAIAGMSLSTAAESYGLGTVMIGGMRNHPDKVAKLLGFPKGVYVVYGLCIGWPSSIPPQKPRLPQDVIIHKEKYTQDDPKQELLAYDKALADHYQSEGRSTPEAAWTGIIANRLNAKRRGDLRSILQELGFDFD